MAAGLAVAVVVVVVVERFIGVRAGTCASKTGLHPVGTTVNRIGNFFF